MATMPKAIIEVECKHERECAVHSKFLLDDAGIKHFIYDVTLHLQANRSKTPEQHDAMFQRAYRLYVKHRVDPQDPNTSNEKGEAHNAKH